ncbi:cytochrome c oxidase assembly protein [Streptomyces griseoluteus]|uniref:cytochrome c oxidase assembly protein n=1 Tax=Streptomyces griseoluteus TaxID=29306 RepID=UPI0036F7C36B
MTEHHHGAGTVLPQAVTVVLAVLALAALHHLAVRRAVRRNPAHDWPTWRTISFVTGLALLAVALVPPAPTGFPAHMAQHMLIGMYAPLALVLAAPGTLALRALPPAGARRITAVLHSPPVRCAVHPVSALLLSTGSLAVLYFTPLYNTAMNHPAGHWLMAAHFLLSGCLFAHAIAGPDPAPGRPGVPARLACLGIAIAAHALIAQALYGGFFTDVHAPIDQVRRGAEIMYYGGDIAELLLAAALVTTWRPERRGGPRRRAPATALPETGISGRTG